MYKIGHVTRFYFPIVGGQEAYIQSLNKLLEKNGFRTLVIQPHVLNQPKLEGVLFTKPFPFVYRLNKKIANFSWCLFAFELRRYRKVLEDQDILISHYSFQFPVLRRYSHKLIVLSHGVLYGQNKITWFDKLLAKRDQQLLGSGAVIVANDTHFLRSIGIQIEPSSFYFQEVKKNIWFIPNCVDTLFYAPNPEITKKKVILVPRNIRPDRGILLAIEAFAEFSQIYKDHQLVIAGGPMSGDYYAACCQAVGKCDLKEKVHFVGFVSTEQLLELYRSSEITLVPSLEKEGTSLSALESMACGTPVVATNVAGLLDIPCVHAGVSPIILAEAMSKTVANLDHIGKQQRENVMIHFSIKNWEEAWMNVMNKINGKS